MKTLAFFFVLISTFILPLSARLGETVPEATARYGDPAGRDEKLSALIFNKSGFTLCAYFHQGRVGMLYITKDGDPNEFIKTHPAISDTEITSFLKANGAGIGWEDTTGQFEMVSQSWKTKDGKKIAIYNKIKHELTIVTMEFAEAHEKQKAQDEKKNLEGF